MSAGFEDHMHTADLDINAIKDLAKSASDDDLRLLILHFTNVLHERKTGKSSVSAEFMDKHFTYLPKFLWRPSNTHDVSTNLPSDSDIYDPNQLSSDLRGKLESLGLEDNTSLKVKTQWLTSGSNVSHPEFKNAKPLKDFPQVSKLLELVNKQEDVIGEMNSCIINCFRSKTSRHYPHADNEKFIDSSCSIATVSVGPTRDFCIYKTSTGLPR